MTKAADKNTLELGKIVANAIYEKHGRDLTKKEIKEIKKDVDAYIDQIISKAKNQKDKSK